MSETVGRRTFLTGMAGVMFAAGGLSVAKLAPPTDAHTPRPSRRKDGRLRGAAVRPEHIISGSSMASLVARHCDILVPEYHGQWSAMEWERGNVWYGNLDPIAAYCRENGIVMRGHSLLWDKMMPHWARAAIEDGRDWSVVEQRVKSLLPRYEDVTRDWIVVNEMIDTESGVNGLRRTSLHRAFGDEYIARALRTAHEVAPNSRLLINEYGLEYDNPIDEARRSALLRLAERLVRDEVPLDAIGIQAHLELAKGMLPSRRLACFFDELRQMGLAVEITELDVLEDRRAEPIQVRDRRVADAVRSFLDIVDEQPAVGSVTTWGMSDRDSWLQQRAVDTRLASVSSPVDCLRINRGLPFDGRLRPKAMLSALSES